MKKQLLTSLSAIYVIVLSQAYAQEKPYYYQIPKEPASYTAENVAARMVDGLGFRYFWATEGLRPEDLAYDPNDKARSSRQTLEHIYDLTTIIRYTSLELETKGDPESKNYGWEILRDKTLENIKIASDALKKTDAGLSNKKLRFTRPDGSKTEYDFWYLINGPIADALWHVGQVVSFRRSSGNPLPEGVSVLQGKKQ
jgi:hypothetical protein